MKKRILTAILSLCMVLPSFTGCESAAEIDSGAAQQDYPVVVNEVTIQSQPEGVAVLSDNLADIVLALGYEINLKARSADCTQADLKVLPEVTAADADKMKELGVTLVLTDEALSEEETTALNDQGITVLPLAPATTRSEFTKLYTEVGSALAGGSTGYEKAEKTATNIFTTLDDMTRIIPNSDVPATAVYITDLEGSVATGDTFTDILLSSAGFINGMKGSTGGKVEVSSLVSANPDYIFCAPGLKAKLADTDGFKDMDAVKNGHVCEIDPALMSRQGRSILTVVSEMAGFAHPELSTSSESSDTESSAESQSSASSESSQEESSKEESSKEESSKEESSKEESSKEESSKPASTTLKRGDSGDDVLKLQERLDELGYMFTLYDGTFDQGTEQAVKDFQLKNNYNATGEVNTELWNTIFSDEAIPSNG